MDRAAVLATRMATQRLSGPPAATPAQVVSELLCVQAQDAPLAQAMIALRCEEATDATVRTAVASGALVRTHILRPTWHYVAAADLRWLLQLTAAKVISGMTARHRQLELDEPRVGTGLAVFTDALAGRRFANRAELGQLLSAAAVLDRTHPLFGQQVGHLLLLAEMRALVCSAPVDALEHRYALVAEVVPPTPEIGREEALTELVARFVAGHGPVALSDLIRWARVTLGEARAAIDRLGGRVASIRVDGEELWYEPASALPETRTAPAWLLSTFDEAFLSYRKVPWPRSARHPAGDNHYRFAEAGAGVVIHDLQDVGSWKRTREKSGPRIDLVVDDSLSRTARAAIGEAVDHLATKID